LRPEPGGECDRRRQHADWTEHELRLILRAAHEAARRSVAGRAMLRVQRTHAGRAGAATVREGRGGRLPAARRERRREQRERLQQRDGNRDGGKTWTERAHRSSHSADWIGTPSSVLYLIELRRAQAVTRHV